MRSTATSRVDGQGRPAAVVVNGVRLYYELHGGGEPLVLVHGSWDDATVWQSVVPALAEAFTVLVYDRRGHSRSERPDTQGSVDEDGDDLAGLLEALDRAPAHVVASSFGGNIALRLAARRPDLFASLTCHEPPLFGLLDDHPESEGMLEHVYRVLTAVAGRVSGDDHEGAARQFVEDVALGPGAWDELPPEEKAMLVRNAPTFLDEFNDPSALTIDREALARLEMPVRLTQGTESPPLFPRVIDRLCASIPAVERGTIEGAGHVPHVTVPKRYRDLTMRIVRQA